MTAYETTLLPVKFIKPLALAIASAAISFAVIDVSPARAATVVFDIDVNVTSGPLDGNLFEGFLSFDDSIESDTLFGDAGEFEIAFDFLGETYTEEDEEGFGLGFPTLTVENGSPVTLDWLVDFGDDGFGLPPNFSNDFAFCGTAFSICENNVGSFVYQIGEVPDEIEQGVGEITYTRRNQQPPPASVPEPGAVAALSLFAVGGLLKRAIASSPSQK